MRSVVLDKIASVTLNCHLAREVKVADEYPCREGDVLAVRVLTRKSTYNTLELPTGRFSNLVPGDVVAGALGHRRALVGYAGRIPTELRTGGRIHILNLGGVLGICTSVNPDFGQPFECEVLGQILHFPYLGERIGVPANIGHGLPPLDQDLRLGGVPVVAVVGTCMNAGKTQACLALVQEFTRQRLSVMAAKATGVSLRRDILTMEDAGASRTITFTDLGVVTTSAKNAPALTRTMLNRIAAEEPDLIILELGDGLMGSYGVDAILASPDITRHFNAIVLAANDPVGSWGAIRKLREEYGLRTSVVTGPATDNAAGTELILAQMGTPAFNARTAPGDLAALVLEELRLVKPELGAARE
jgi:hypothetical protein